jgi:hypothetical protein
MTTSADTRAQAPSKMGKGSSEEFARIVAPHNMATNSPQRSERAPLSYNWFFGFYSRARKHSLQRSLYRANWFTGIASCLPLSSRNSNRQNLPA